MSFSVHISAYALTVSLVSWFIWGHIYTHPIEENYFSGVIPISRVWEDLPGIPDGTYSVKIDTYWALY